MAPIVVVKMMSLTICNDIDDVYDDGYDDCYDGYNDYIPSAISENKVISTAVMAVLARRVFTSEVFITIFVIIFIVIIAIIIIKLHSAHAVKV